MCEKDKYSENEGILGRIRAGDESAAEELIKVNSGLVWNAVKRFISFAEAEDLYQIGCIGLIKAARRFDTSFGVRFSTYAVPMIMGEIKRFLRDDNIIKISRRHKETSIKINRELRRLTNELGREPHLSEIAAALSLSEQEIAMAIEASAKPHSLSTPIDGGDGGKLTLMNTLAGEDKEDKLIEKIALRELVDSLDEKERTIIELRYFENRTQVQTAQILDISQVQVSRMEKKILLKMRQMIG